jgi:hypothetical protein
MSTQSRPHRRAELLQAFTTDCVLFELKIEPETPGHGAQDI